MVKAFTRPGVGRATLGAGVSTRFGLHLGMPKGSLRIKISAGLRHKREGIAFVFGRAVGDIYLGV